MKSCARERIKKALAKDHACYVLITCNQPSEDGCMQVEFNYEGDVALAAYLIQGAQTFIDEQETEKELLLGVQ